MIKKLGKLKKIRFIKKVLIVFFHRVLTYIKKNPLASLIVLLALLLRVIGFYPGFSESYSDEGTSYGRAVGMLYHRLKPDFFDYPAGMAFIHLIIYFAFFIPITVVNLIVFHFDKVFELLKHIDDPYYFRETLKVYIFGPNSIYAMYWSRSIAALFGTGAVFLTYLVGRKLFSKEAGIFAAFFIAVNYRHVLGSHFGLPDVHNSFFGMLSLLAALFVLENYSKKRYILAGIAAGVMFSIKYQIFGFLPLVVVHVLRAIKKRNFLYLFHPYIFLAALAMIATFIVINPYYLFNLQSALASNQTDYNRYGMGSIAFRQYGYFYLFHFGVGVLPSLFVIAGLLLGLILRFQKSLLVLSFALSHLFIIMVWSNGAIFPRNFVTVMPFLMLFAGYFFSVVFVNLRKYLGLRGALLAIILLVVVNAKPLKDSSILAYSLAQPFNSVKLAKWIEEKLPKITNVRSYPNDQNIRLAFKAKDIQWVYWLYDKGFNTLSEFQDEGTDFAILNTATLQNVTYGWRQRLSAHTLFSYNSVPFDFIEDDFFGLTVREFRQYTVFESYKPPQVLEQHAFLVFKIPKKPKDVGKRIAYFGFDKDEKNWKIMGNYDMYPPKAYWDQQEGSKNAGSIAFQSGETSTSHVVFSPVSITQGKFYTVEGFIKNTHQPDVFDIDGYLRVEFYKDNEEILEKKSVGVAISQQAKIDGQWHKVTASIRAPEEARYMTVSFQRRDSSRIVYIDDIEVFETDKIPEETFKEIPYIKSTIPVEGLYYDSFL